MSEQEFDAYLRLLCRFLHLSGDQRTAIARELRSHMEDRLQELLARGFTREEAIQTALDEFGDAAALANDFGRIGRRRRWIMRTTTATMGIAAAVLFVSFLLPENRPLLPAPTFSQAQTPPASAREAVSTPMGISEESWRVEDARFLNRQKENAADRAVRERLETILPVVSFPEGASFAELLDFIREAGQVTIDVNWPGLAAVGVERTTVPGELAMKNVKVETLLDRLLDKITVAGGGSRIAYDIADGMVNISTEDEIYSHTVVRVYDIRDLTTTRENLTAAQKDILEILIRNLPISAGPGPAMGPGWGGSGNQPDTERLAQSVAHILSEIEQKSSKDLIKVITTTITPDRWAPDGQSAPLGSIDVWNDRLIVRHTEAVQHQIADLLQQIRTSRSTDAHAHTPATNPAGAAAQPHR